MCEVVGINVVYVDWFMCGACVVCGVYVMCGAFVVCGVYVVCGAFVVCDVYVLCGAYVVYGVYEVWGVCMVCGVYVCGGDDDDGVLLEFCEYWEYCEYWESCDCEILLSSVVFLDSSRVSRRSLISSSISAVVGGLQHFFFEVLRVSSSEDVVW